MCLNQLFDGFTDPLALLELGAERDANLVVVGRQVRELDERAQRLVDLTFALHALGVSEEVGAGVGEEPLRRAYLAHLEVDGVPRRQIANDLLADRDGVVGKLGVDVEVDGLLVLLDGGLDVAYARAEVAGPVVEADIRLLVAIQAGDRLYVQVERLAPLLFLLVAARLLF